MKLSEKTKNKLREIIEYEIRNVPEGTRISLDEEMLDELIFSYGKLENGQEFKVPVWTGDFLSKIDLSKLSFENVVLEPLSTFKEEGEISLKTEAELSQYSDLNPYVRIISASPELYEKPVVNFSNTNININFEDAIYDQLVSWDLSGVDLSCSNLKKIRSIDTCNLFNTNIKSEDIPDTNNIWNSNLSNNDLSEAIFIIDKEKNIDNIILSNTGIKIVYHEDEEYKEKMEKYINEGLKKGNIVGCYFNDILVNEEMQTLDDVKEENEIDIQKEEYLLTNLAYEIQAQCRKARVYKDIREYLNEKQFQSSEESTSIHI